MRKSQMACVALYLHPEIAVEVPGVRYLNLRPENVFGRSFPESSSEIASRLKPRNEFVVHRMSRPRRTYSVRDCADMPLVGDSVDTFDRVIVFD